MSFKKNMLLPCLLLLFGIILQAQVTFPVNGVADVRNISYAFINATIYKDGITPLKDATFIIKDGKITAIGIGIQIPQNAAVIDLKGKSIYPSFIDIYSDYGIASSERAAGGTGGFGGGGFRMQQQFESTTKGPVGWNQAIKSELDAITLFSVDDSKAAPLREAGFGTVLTHNKDGIARGTGLLVSLASQKENLVILKAKASAHYSLSKGTSTQSYPSSMMGVIALLRQSFIDANWYKGKPAGEGLNLTLEAWNNNIGLPQIFEANDKWNNLRADRIGDEFGVQFIIKAGQNEYQRIKEMKATKAAFIVPLNFPQAQDVEDPNDARFVAVTDMKHWEMAPVNPAAFEKEGIPFCLTTADLRSPGQFWTQVKKAMEYGLTEKKVMESLTKTPAELLGVYNEVGSIEVGKWANFLVTSGSFFDPKTIILQNWVQGNKYLIKDDAITHALGSYKVAVKDEEGNTQNFTLDLKSGSSGTFYNTDTLTSRISFDGKIIKIGYAPAVRRQPRPAGGTPDEGAAGPRPGGRGGAAGGPTSSLPANVNRLNGMINGNEINGTGADSLGNLLTWTATLVTPYVAPAENAVKKTTPEIGEVIYPFKAFGWTEKNTPKQETILIKNATVWTNEKEGVLTEADVLLKNGKIAAVGKNLSDNTARIIDGKGKHVTPGIIDEHSHIAAASINEGAQSVTSEVRIADNLNPDDVNIYRQLGGGVTTSHILHGSANTIGGQTQLIKLRWGANDEDLKFKNWPGQIKFALGENVKRSSSTQGNSRYPDTRMGVEQVLVDAFTRAKDYQHSWKEYNDNKNKKGFTGTAPRRDLELEALVEILEKKRFITCHSYVQSEINAAMEVANQMGYTVNTFTHILEGYKVADKMKAHGSFVSTFSDWWAYKLEVQDAIPQNANIMHNVGLVVAINSDDAEMARHLNQEAAKSIKYGGMTEEDALKMVTLNPAKMLHVEQYVGSLKAGKDADVVLWTDHPLSVYAKPIYTIVDGTIYFDRDKDLLAQQEIQKEKSRLIKKMNGEKRGGAAVIPAQPTYTHILTCRDHNHKHGLLDYDDEEENLNQ